MWILSFNLILWWILIKNTVNYGLVINICEIEFDETTQIIWFTEMYCNILDFIHKNFN